MPEQEAVIDFSQFPAPDSIDFENMPIEEYGLYDMCTIYVLEATAQPSGQWFFSGIPCDRPTGDEWCDGDIELNRYDLPAQIKWHCEKCGQKGKIINFKGTPWDISDLPEDEQQQKIASYLDMHDPMELLEQLPEEELQEFMGMMDRLMKNSGIDTTENSGGLDSRQLYQLLGSEWETADSLVKLNDSLPLKEINQSLFFYNARTFLLYLKQQGSFSCTGAGNLKRKTVSALIERMHWPDEYIKDVQSVNKAISEEDVWLLHVIRVLLDLAGLIHKRKGFFHLTKKRIKLLEDDHAGQLYRRLFYTYFREMNMGYIVNTDELWGLQDTISYMLYRLGLLDNKWKSIHNTTGKILSPLVYDQLEMEGMGDTVVYSYLIKPLAFFGLLETRFSNENSDTLFGTPDEFRKQPLFDKFLMFDIEETQIPDNVIPLNNMSANNRKKTSTKNGNLTIYQLKITLQDITPAIWRRVLVRSDTSLPDLHKIIQSSMGWSNSHLHQFIKNRQFYSIPFDDGWGEDRIIDSRNFQINDLMQEEKQTIIYEYDFGDSWRHNISLEQILPVDAGKDYPVCTGGERNSPPEDCGGLWGYQQMLDGSGQNDPEIRYEWINEPSFSSFDPEYFNKKEVNNLLHSKNYGVLEL